MDVEGACEEGAAIDMRADDHATANVANDVAADDFTENPNEDLPLV